jgi:peptidoglycan hydrolase-like protein with peptidoglycan-binding domain
MRAPTWTRQELRTTQPGQLRTRLTITLVAFAAVLGLGAGGLAVTRADDGVALVASGNPATPGAFTGYGFDQCLTPSQAKMDAWLGSSPFFAVGVYISGNSRACRSQPNLTPTWVSTQLANGWRILPITLGAQSSCVGRFPRYSDDPTISLDPTNAYAAARAQAAAEAATAVQTAGTLGIVAGSTLYYDLEGWSDWTNTACREAALAFLSTWTQRVRTSGYVSGVYSSAGSGMRILDQARAQGRTDVTLPDQIWLARYDNVADTSATQYISDAGWAAGQRIKQYQGGHDETWGGATINIDRNMLNVGGGSRAAAESHCGGVQVDFADYPKLVRGMSRPEVRALKCLLREQGITIRSLTPYFGSGLTRAMNLWQRQNGFAPTLKWQRGHWTALLARGGSGVEKIGSAGTSVWRLQRALNAKALHAPVNGVFDAATDTAVRTYQQQRGLPVTGVVTPDTWARLYAGR